MERAIDSLLAKAALMKASDIHFSSGEDPVVRINGNLVSFRDISLLLRCSDEGKDSERESVPKKETFVVSKPQVSLIGKDSESFRLFEPILPEKQRSMLEKDGECDFAYALRTGQRFRINLYHSKGRLAAAVRVIPEKIPTCSELGMPDAVKRLSGLKSGLVLVTGATGSGKSTTLAAILNEINECRHVHILTLEDPIEYNFTPVKSLIHQREVGNDTASFATGLRAALRENPDIIMVGELRDLESIAIAVTAAETGHLVFATLHTRSAADTVNRMIDVFPEQQQRQIRIQLAGSLQAVVCQQLLPDKQGNRTAAFEVMIMIPALRTLIREGKTQQIYSYIQTGSQYGMQTMKEAVEQLKWAGKI